MVPSILEKAEQTFALVDRRTKQKSLAETDQAFFPSSRVCLREAVAHASYVLCTQAFGRPFNLILKLFALSQSFVPAKTVNVVSVYEDISRSIIRFDEAVAFVYAKPLYSTACHDVV